MCGPAPTTASAEFVAAVASLLTACRGTVSDDGRVEVLRQLSLAVQHSQPPELACDSVALALEAKHSAIYQSDFAAVVLRFLAESALQRRLIIRRVSETVSKLMSAPGWEAVVEADRSVVAGINSSAPELCVAFRLAEQPEVEQAWHHCRQPDAGKDDGETAAEMFCWKYAVWVGALAKLNPVRWSHYLSAEDLVAELQALPVQSRPIRVRGASQCKEFASVSDALSHLQS